ncbi:MAG TPA: HypC/HybG/HupF family hydrogenase formation chaperone [Nitrospirae bacterium]|nr:hydrogenase isoenzymes formation protein HypC [bacterium BMS3Abin10]GBE39622.1 hydrogenase isoenzymes formation protein HypC [bacterium BMS3Bbin08]HDH00842.1 HypC/HybG/HupF family hydrogenase formation chaperone [Nitrospirota bacterium]HDK81295.1 HypC/HybG/HupF family hydrogenase formation chaperone [Nitrospirota bacterium]
MCVGVPMKMIDINYPAGTAEAKGVTRRIGLQLIPEEDIQIGDYVIVHVGFAIEKLDRKQADEIWNMLDEMLSIADQEEEDA